MTRDPVCKMDLNEKDAVATTSYRGDVFISARKIASSVSTLIPSSTFLEASTARRKCGLGFGFLQLERRAIDIVKAEDHAASLLDIAFR